MKFKARNAKNGMILESEDGEILYQFSGEDTEIEDFASFLYTILDNYGPHTSRYSAKRIYIEIRPGDKYEDTSE